jgi:hypothetical protein
LSQVIVVLVENVEALSERDLGDQVVVAPDENPFGDTKETFQGWQATWQI